MKMKSLTITLDVHTIEELKIYADAIGISIAEFIEDVVIESITVDTFGITYAEPETMAGY